MFDTWALERHLVFKVNVNDTCLFVLHILRSKLLELRKVDKMELQFTNYIKVDIVLVCNKVLTFPSVQIIQKFSVHLSFKYVDVKF